MNAIIDHRDILESTVRNANSGPDLLKRASSALQEFGIRGLIQSIAQLLEREEHLTIIAARSHIQGNGFCKIVLHEFAGAALRLHLWSRFFDVQENLHSHRWPLASTVLTGALHTEFWSDSGAETAKEYDEYHYLGRNMPLRSVGKAKVALRDKVTYAAGDTYTLDPDQMHRVILKQKDGDVLTSTLMLRSCPTRTWARNVVVNRNIPNLATKSITAVELKTILSDYVAFADRYPRKQ